METDPDERYFYNMMKEDIEQQNLDKYEADDGFTLEFLKPLLQVMEDDNLTEFQYVIENGKWNVTIK